VYIKIEDKILYQVAVKKITIEDALKTIEYYGDNEIWGHLLDALRNKILPTEHFEVKREKKIEENVIEDVPTKEILNIPDEFQFLADAFIKLNKKNII
jgi:hypothetical protein